MKNIYVDLLDVYRYIDSEILLDKFFIRYEEASDIVDACLDCIIRHTLVRNMMGNWQKNYMECAFNELTVGLKSDETIPFHRTIDITRCVVMDSEVWRLAKDCLNIVPCHPYMVFLIGGGVWRIITKDFTYGSL